jgi:dTDP-4-dehydrorhamnose reductase
MKVNIERVSIKDYASPVRRPAYSVLDNARLQSMNLDCMTDWKTALKNYFDDRKNTIK